MGLLAEIKKLEAEGAAFEHTVTSWVAKEFQAFHNAEPSLIAISDRVFPYAKSAIQIALGLAGQTVLSAEAGTLLDSIHAKIDTASALLYDFGANPTVQSAVTKIQNDIASVESVAGIKSTAAQAALAKATAGLAALLTAIQGAINAAKPPAPPAQNPTPVPAN